MDIAESSLRDRQHGRNVLVILLPVHRKSHWKLGKPTQWTWSNIIEWTEESCSLLNSFTSKSLTTNWKHIMLFIFCYLITSRLFHHWNNITWIWQRPVSLYTIPCQCQRGAWSLLQVLPAVSFSFKQICLVIELLPLGEKLHLSLVDLTRNFSDSGSWPCVARCQVSES